MTNFPETRRTIWANWGANNSVANGGQFEPFNQAISPPGGIVAQPYGAIKGVPNGQINEDVQALWIGSESEAHSVSITSPTLYDGQRPVGVSVDSPWVGYLKAPIYIFQDTPVANSLFFHTLELNYTPIIGALPGNNPPQTTWIPPKRKPRRYYSGTITLVAVTPQLFAFPTFGRKLVNLYVKNETAANIAITVNATQQNHDFTGGFCPNPLNAADSGPPSGSTGFVVTATSASGMITPLVNAYPAIGTGVTQPPFNYADFVSLSFLSTPGGICRFSLYMAD